MRPLPPIPNPKGKHLSQEHREKIAASQKIHYETVGRTPEHHEAIRRAKQAKRDARILLKVRLLCLLQHLENRFPMGSPMQGLIWEVGTLAEKGLP